MPTSSRIFPLFLMLALANCGGEPQAGTSNSPSTPTQENSGGITFDIHKTWSVARKQCEGKSVAVKPGEAYRFDETTYVQIAQVADDITRTCVAGDFYLIVMMSMMSSNDGFEQEGWLRPMGRKQTCRMKKDGVKTDDIVTTQEDLPDTHPPMELMLRGSFGSSDAHLSLRGHVDCPGGRLDLVLKP